MDLLTIILAVFSALGAVDRICGDRLGLGREFEKGFGLLGDLCLSMMGMIVLSPLLAKLMEPGLEYLYVHLRMDPSIVSASLFACDMGGAPLSDALARDGAVGRFNALVVSSTMGATISFTVPFAMETVKTEARRNMMLGFLCGIVTIPVGCFLAGLASGLPVGALGLNLLPLTVFAGIIVCGLFFCPEVCVKIFTVLGTVIKTLITAGLLVGILQFLLKVELLPGLASFEEAAMVCINAAVALTGAFPLLYLVTRRLRTPLGRLGRHIGLEQEETMCMVTSLATSIPTFEKMNTMSGKGIMVNSAFLISAGFTFADHLAFTMAYCREYVPWVILAKLSGGLLAVVLALVLYRRTGEKSTVINGTEA